jgi:hypothetical protein
MAKIIPVIGLLIALAFGLIAVGHHNYVTQVNDYLDHGTPATKP